jgi:threonine dehydrogenase-like Zn-dependent dehydrogenase
MSDLEYIYSSEKSFFAQPVTRPESIAADEILVKVSAVGICGSDLYHHKIYRGDQLRLGHEWVGSVVKKGHHVGHLEVGDMVTSSSTLGCGECAYCLKTEVNMCENPIHLCSEKLGALRNYLQISSFNAIKLHSHNSSDVLLEVMAVAEEAMALLTASKTDGPKKALVLGAGTVGILCAYLLKERGFEVLITDVQPTRVKRSIEVGLKGYPLNFLMMDSSAHHQFDVIIDATSDREPSVSGWSLLPIFGSKNLTAIMVGKYIKPIEIKPDQLSKLASRLIFMRGVPLNTLELTVKKWSGQLDFLASKLITHHFDAGKLNEGFEVAANAKISGKVVITL